MGKQAYVAHRSEEPIAILCSLFIDDHTSSTGEKRYPLGWEPIVTRDGALLIDSKGRRSFANSAGSAPSLGKHLVMSYLPPGVRKGWSGTCDRIHGAIDCPAPLPSLAASHCLIQRTSAFVPSPFRN